MATIIKENRKRKFGSTTISFEEPRAAKKPKTVKVGSNELTDNYYWLRDDKREDKEMLEYLTKENEYTNNVMATTQKLQDTMYNEIKSRMKEDDETYPYPKGEWNSEYRYFTRNEEGKSYVVYCRLNTTTGQTDVLLDVNKLAEGHSQCDVDSVTVSPNHNVLTYAVDFTGNEKYDVVFVDLTTRQTMDHKLEKLMFGKYEWSPDCKSVYYCMSDDADRLDTVHRYDLETKTSTLLFEEPDTLFSVDISVSEDSRFLFLNVASDDSNETYYIDFAKPDSMTLIKKREEKFLYEVTSHNDNFVMLTNKDAVNFKLVKTPINDPVIWQDIRYNPNEYICGFVCFKDHIAVSVRTCGFKTIAVIDSKTNEWTQIKFPEEVFTTNFHQNEVYDTTKLWFEYTSLTESNILYEYDMADKTLKQLHKKEIPNYDPSLYESKLLQVPSYYGATVPVSIVYRKDMRKGEAQPFYLYGYGSYGLCVEPQFSINTISLLDRGCIFGIPHIRGGSELGYDWYLDGKMHNKMNTFLDFITCTEYLIKEKYTTPQQLAIEGRIV